MYDALIIANGDIPSLPHWQEIQTQAIICTDGAVHSLLELSITPDIIVGDMDSISENTNKGSIQSIKSYLPKCKIQLSEDQETTDFEKALVCARENGFKRLLCLGLFGKAADHSIHNLCLLHQYSQTLNLMALHTFNNHTQWIFPLSSSMRICTQKDVHLSFFPYHQAKITALGLKWPLNDTILSLKGNTGVRNITTEEEITLQCEGDCLCFITSPTCPVIVHE